MKQTMGWCTQRVVVAAPDRDSAKDAAIALVQGPVSPSWRLVSKRWCRARPLHGGRWSVEVRVRESRPTAKGGR